MISISNIETLSAAAQALPKMLVWGEIRAIEGGIIRLKGLERNASLGDRVLLDGPNASFGEIIAIEDKDVMAMACGSLTGLRVGARATLVPGQAAAPCDAWLGRVLSAEGTALDGLPSPANGVSTVNRVLTQRRRLGGRVNTGIAPFDTFLPLCRGQRVGLFAGSGVGKSTLLAGLANGVDADVVVVAMIGERSREIREFAEETLGEEGLKRSVIIAATCDAPAPSKRRAALLAMETAEYFRDQGKHVLLLFDSITRYADAHREIALTAGETPSLRAYPPSTSHVLAELVERAGPGDEGAGDITAIFNVLVAGSDMDEPIADMVRGFLDGHVVMERAIAERGRFPAIDVRRSVSRALPKAASEVENQLLQQARHLIASYEEAAPMIQSGLYLPGADPVIDRAIEVWPGLDAFVGERYANCAQSFQRLAEILAQQSQPAPA